MNRIALIGDVMLGRLVDDYLGSIDRPCYVWGDTAPLFRNADISICNLECVLADDGEPWTETPKAFHFRSHAKNIATLSCVDIDAVTLANNHSFDFGVTAAEEMFELLGRKEIVHTGAGLTLETAKQPAELQAGNMRIRLLSFCDDMPEWAAGKDRPGIFYVPPAPRSPAWQELMRLVRRTKAHTDFLIVSPHWGPNWGYEVQPIYIAWAQSLIDAGADMVFGHSGHVYRGIEIYKGKPIIYSAGDFIDDYAISEEEPNDEGFVYVAEIEDNAVQKLKLHPIVIENFQAHTAGLRSKTIASRMLSLCASFETNNCRYDSRAQMLTIPVRASQRAHTATKGTHHERA